MATVTRTTIFADGNTLTAAQLNNEFNNLLNAPAIVNSDISAGAAIATSKINATFPTGAIVGTTDSQTLTNKTLTSPVINTPTNTGTVVTITADSDGGTITFDLNQGPIHSVTLGASGRTLALANSAVGKVFVIRLIQGGSGSNTVNWFSTIHWTNGNTAPTLTTTANHWDTVAFICTASNVYDGYVVGQNLA